MQWSDIIVIPPRAEPMHLNEARQHLRLSEDDSCDEDGLIRAWIAAAREAAEDETGRQLVLAMRELRLDCFPRCPGILIPSPPLRTVEAISYMDADGNENEMPLSSVIVDTAGEPGCIVLKAGQTWPQCAHGPGAVRIRYKAGYTVPFTVDVHADTLTALDHWFNEGDRVRLWNSGGSLPAPLKEHTDYFVVNVSGDTFQLAETAGGSPIDLKTPGSGTSFLGLLPESFRAAMKLTIGSRFEFREDIISGTIANEVPQAARALLWPRRVWYPGPVGVR